jgi:hypothetical protein
MNNSNELKDDNRTTHLLTQLGYLIGENYKSDMLSKFNILQSDVLLKFAFFLFSQQIFNSHNTNTPILDDSIQIGDLFLRELKTFIANNGGPNINRQLFYCDEPTFKNKLEIFFRTYFTIPDSECNLPFDYYLPELKLKNNNLEMLLENNLQNMSLD